MLGRSEDGDHDLFGDILTEETLRTQYNVENLESLQSLSLVIDTSEHTIAHLADKLTALEILQLDGSRIHSVRDLGTRLTRLTYLSLNDCNLSGLDGIGVLTNLRELHVADNQIDDLTPLATHPRLEVLGARSNNILDMSALEMASTCDCLIKLDLRGNPIGRISNFRVLVLQLIPHLIHLNGEAVELPANGAGKQVAPHALLQRAMEEVALQRENMEEEQRMEALLLEESNGFLAEPDPTKKLSFGPDSVSSTQRNSIDNAVHSDMGFSQNDGSELTHGSTVVLAGSMSLAMRRRRAEMATAGRPAASDAKLNTQAARYSGSNLLKEIDDALDMVNNGTATDVQEAEWVHEGDITSAVIQIPPSVNTPLTSIRRRSSRHASPPGLRPGSAFSRGQSSRRPGNSDQSSDSRPSTGSSSQSNAESKSQPQSKYSYISIDPSASTPFMVTISQEHLEQIRILQKGARRRMADSDSDDSDDSDDEGIAITHRARREHSHHLQDSIVSPRLMRNHSGLWQEMTDRCQNPTQVHSNNNNQTTSPRWARRKSSQSSTNSLSLDSESDYNRHSSSDKVSRSLGFDLRDSLAAIDEWIAQTSESDGSTAPRDSVADKVSHEQPSNTLPPRGAIASPSRAAQWRDKPLHAKAQGNKQMTNAKGAVTQSDEEVVVMLRHVPKHLRSKEACKHRKDESYSRPGVPQIIVGGNTN